MEKIVDSFDDIRPYNDQESKIAMARLLQNNEFLDLLSSKNNPFKFILLNTLFRYLSRPLLRRNLSKILMRINNVYDFQEEISKRLVRTLDETTSGYFFSGLETLKAKKSYLFLSNHRDIALDPALVNLAMRQVKRETVRIAIGDNLLSKEYATDLIRINKSFIVKRSFANRRQKLEFLKRLSQYIQQCLSKDKCSVWIAQAEGRAKTGKDFTDTALLKMLALCKSKVESFSDIVNRTSIIPVSIAYEYDPCIKEKVSEIYAKQNGQEYIKSTSEDLDSIVKGFLDFKGRVNVSFGNVISEGIDTADCLAKAIDQQIHSNYCLFPSNIVAWQSLNPDKKEILVELKSKWPNEDWVKAELDFKNHLISCLSDEFLKIATQIYAEPVNSRLMYPL